MAEHLCEFCKTVAVDEAGMICDACFEKENAAQKLDEKIAEYHNEQYRLRYSNTAIFDNEVGRISVSYHRKILRTWNYNLFGHLEENEKYRAKIEARGYLEGWLDCVQMVGTVIGKEKRK
jgi:hypothetical protein